MLTNLEINKLHKTLMINFHQYQEMKLNRELQMQTISMKFLIKIGKEGITLLENWCQY
jgi:hypothetical protein